MGATVRRATQRRTRLALTFAAVLALHALGGWLFLMKTRLLVTIPKSASLELIYLPPTAAPAESPREAPSSLRRSRRERAAAEPAAPSASAPIENRAPRIDWSAELARVAHDAAEAASASNPRDFGFPHAKDGPAPKAPEFGWYRAHTHRVESLEEGGLLVHLGENCVLVFVPLPFVGCRPGHVPANGDLFKHMGEGAVGLSPDGRQ
jgi:hypothetical protein